MRILLLPVAVGAALVLSACSSPLPAATAGATAGSPHATSSTAASAPAAHAAGPVDVCGDFPVATIVAATGRSVYTTATERDGGSEGAMVYACEYTDSTDPANALDGFNLVVYRGGDPDAIMKDLAAAQTSGANAASGIGDRAQTGDGEIDVVVGTDVVVASDALHEGDLAELDPSVLRQLAKSLIAKL